RTTRPRRTSRAPRAGPPRAPARRRRARPPRTRPGVRGGPRAPPAARGSRPGSAARARSSVRLRHMAGDAATHPDLAQLGSHRLALRDREWAAVAEPAALTRVDHLRRLADVGRVREPERRARIRDGRE